MREKLTTRGPWVQQWLRWMALWTGAALIAAGCGSTAQQAARQGLAQAVAAPEESFGDATQMWAGTSGTDGEGVTAAGTAGTDRQRADGTGSPSRGPAQTGTSAVSPPVPRPADGPGTATSEDPVLVGAYYNQGGDEVAQSLGWSGISLGNQRGQFEAVVRDLNERGGMAGRPVEVIYNVQDSTSADSRQVQDEAACMRWTQDNRVAYAVSIVGFSETLISCLSKNGVPFVTIWTAGMSSYYREIAGYLYTPPQMTLDRGVVVQAHELHRLQYFAPGARVGVLYSDDPQTRQALELLRSELDKIGVPIAETYGVGGASADQLFRDMGAAVLRFRSSAIDHVLFIMQGGGAFIFMQAAESQAYRPRYGLTSFDHPAAAESLAPREQLTNAVGVGWRPVIDASWGRQPDPTPATARCFDLMAENNFHYGDGNAAGFALGTCDVLWFLQAGLRDASGEASVASLRRGVEAMGSNYGSPLTPLTRFGPGRYDGPAAVRALAFDEGCACFVYTSGPRPV